MPLAADALNIPACLALVSQGALWGKLCLHRRNKVKGAEPVQSLKRAPEDKSLVVWCLADCRWKSENSHIKCTMHCPSYESANLIISAITGEYLICITTKLDTRSPHQKSQRAGTTAYLFSRKEELPGSGARKLLSFVCCFCCSDVVSDSLWPHGLPHGLSAGVCSNSCPLSLWSYLSLGRARK